MLRQILNVVFTILIFNGSFGQYDVAVTASFSPSSGCDLSNALDISVTVRNDGDAITGDKVAMKYQINGGTVISQNLPPALLAGGGAGVVNFTFDDKVDLSACNTDFNIVVWLELEFPLADVNPANDTLKWTVRNDCTIIPGQVESDELVCYGDNSNTLNLVGWSNGISLEWKFSEDNGSTWGTVGNTTTSHTFSNLTNETRFVVEIEGGECADDVSMPATITIQPTPTGGTLSGPDSLCISNGTGTITLSGNSGAVLDWESSADNGATWTSLGNTTTTASFSGLTQTTLYRALVEGDICADVYSDTLEVYIEELSSAGVLVADTTLCENEDVDLVLGTHVGNFYEWEASADGVVWNSIVNSTDTYNTGSLTSPTYYRVNVTNGICPPDVSNSVFVDVQANVVGGTISGGTATCVDGASGTLTLTGNTGSVLGWESSIDGGTSWNAIANTSSSETYSSLIQTTWYRALIDGGVCNDTYSDTAYITISPNTIAGTLAGDTLICEGETHILDLTGNLGGVTSWESSLDGIVWEIINSTDSSHLIAEVLNSSYYRVIVKNGICNEDTSNVVLVDMLPSPVADAGADITILEGDSVELNGSGGVFGSWLSDSTLSDTSVPNPIANPAVTTTYYWTVISADGCLNTDQVVVTVDPPIPPLDIKNLITSNGDGYNDTWIIEGIEAFPSTSVRVYNIYGTLVFESEDYQNDWEGEFNNKKLPDGTYLYVVMPGGTEDVLKGNLTLIGNE